MDVQVSLQELLQAARQARDAAYAPYSRFRVGAAVRASDGRIFVGANVENASYGLSVCAERVAIFKAVLEGARDIVELAVVTDADESSPPCGACRQVLSEFADDPQVAMGNLAGTVVLSRLGDLFPKPFKFRGP
jgi:cytidine deaminase